MDDIMNSSKKIYEGLTENSDNAFVAEFIQKIFIKETQGLYQWNDVYDELIDEYCEGYINED